ncbi:MAG: phytanoyl-CoA dioxygenase family protein [Holosporales bacterium]|jgi:hypothetical protein
MTAIALKRFVHRKIAVAPPRSYYNICINVLGFNALRTVVYHLSWKLRGLIGNYKATDDDTRMFERDGIISIENFLPDEDFKKIRADFEKTELNPIYQQYSNVPQFAYKSVGQIFHCQNELLHALIVKNPRLRKIVEFGARRKIGILPTLIYERFHADREEQLFGQSPDRSDTLHYDVPFNSMRAFLYLADADEDNAAFIYSPGTHKFSWKRVRFECYDSIKQALKRAAAPNSRIEEIDEDLLADIGHNPKSMVGKANTLVIFNAMGMHKRGKFRKFTARESLLICYRGLDTPSNFLFRLPFLRNYLKVG